MADIDPVTLDTPPWLLSRWTHAYGDETGRAIARACTQEPSLDITVKTDAESWAARLRGRVLPTGTIRTVAHGAVTLLPGFAEGAWWVQDAAAAIPARLMGDINGKQVADLCAAPGGKTAQLALAGAHVTAVDRSAPRLMRLTDNLRRLNLAAETVTADVAEWPSEPFDAVLLDAPCSSTGTIRRHPDISWRKSATDLSSLMATQARLLDRVADLVKPGGTVVYCVCSLEPEEGEQAIDAVLAREPRLRRRPIGADEMTGIESFITPAGDLRTLPCHWPDAEPRMAGLDGFFVARLERR
jgi:16S rRNA (cytosine967-C5)-methyltransferase